MNILELIEQHEKELKPCPHCGGKATRQEENMAAKVILKKCPFCGEEHKLSMGLMDLAIVGRVYFIRCMKCDANGQWVLVKKEDPDPWDNEKNTFSYTSEAMKTAAKKCNERKRRKA